jgi:arginyl-tRNA synthetase
MADYIHPNKQIIANLIKIEGVTPAELYDLLAVPADAAMGDYALPCFRFAKVLRKPPQVIAQELAKSLTGNGFCTVEAVNGYLNFRLDKLALACDTINKILCEKSAYANSDAGAGKTICIDYSSINIAKPFHIGHLSTTVIGGALYRVYKKLGYQAIGINHLGDWGTQFGKLIVAFRIWGSREELEKKGMLALTALYVRFHTEAEKNPALDEEARRAFKAIEDGDPAALELFYLFKEITLKEVQKVYERLDIVFDSYNGEAFYNDKMAPILKDLEAKNLIVESEGAKVVDLSAYGMPPCLLVKADGATLYATRDLAAAFYRKKTYDFYKCLYVVAYQQNLHFRQVFKVIELMGMDWAKDLIHVPFGMVSLEDGTMSTRKGKVVWLSDVFDKAVEKSLAIITEKSPALQDKEKIAEQIGVGAVVFFALSNNRIKDIVFSYDKVLNFDGETGPYVQYTNVRCNSILRRAENIEELLAKPLAKEELSGIDNKESQALVSLLEKFPSILSDVLEKYEPSLLTRHLIDIAQAFNRFYLEYRILNAEEKDKRARLALVAATHTVLEEGLRLLGIRAPEEM